MPSCYTCGRQIEKYEPRYRRMVHTGNSTRVYFSKRITPSFGSYYSYRTVCVNCAKQLDSSGNNGGLFFGIMLLVAGFIALFAVPTLGFLLLVLGLILTIVALSSKSNDESSNSIPEIEPPLEKKLPFPENSTQTTFESKTETKEPKLEEPEITDEEIDYAFPSVDLLDPKKYNKNIDDEELRNIAAYLQSKLADLNIEIISVSVTPGPTFTLFELVPEEGVSFTKLERNRREIEFVLFGKVNRILLPIPGTNLIGIEVKNAERNIVTLRSVLNTEKFRDSKALLPLALGKGISGETVVADLAKMPHLLIAGTTGSGKTVILNTIIASLLYRLHPSELKFVFIDTKRIEFKFYDNLRYHYLAVSTDVDEDIITQPQNAVIVLKSCVIEMEMRYDLLALAGVRHVTDYNAQYKDGRLKDKDTKTIKHRFLPYIVVIIDELADLMMTTAEEVEESITRIAQLARAVGIHLIIATQRPSNNILTNAIKSNIPTRIACKVVSALDSKTVIDTVGAENLYGNGDVLLIAPDSSKPIRLQIALSKFEESENISLFIGRQKGYSRNYELPSTIRRKRIGGGSAGGTGERDELFDEAARIIVRHQQGSVSLLQRRLSVGYSRAARLVDQLEEAGIVGPFDGSKAREVRIQEESDLEFLLKNLD